MEQVLHAQQSSVSQAQLSCTQHIWASIVGHPNCGRASYRAKRRSPALDVAEGGSCRCHPFEARCGSTSCSLEGNCCVLALYASAVLLPEVAVTLLPADVRCRAIALMQAQLDAPSSSFGPKEKSHRNLAGEEVFANGFLPVS